MSKQWIKSNLFYLKKKDNGNIYKNKRFIQSHNNKGEGEKSINIDHIIHLSKWENKTNKRISTIKSRIKLSDGEILEVKETVEEILKLIELSKSNNPK
jgi:hypothetical protein